MEQHKRAIEKAYKYFNKRNIDEVLSLMHPAVEWPNGWEGGYVKGHEGVRDYWTRQWKEISPHVVPTNLTEMPDGCIEVLVKQTVKDLAGKELFNGFVKHIYTFNEKGLISKMEIQGV